MQHFFQRSEFIIHFNAQRLEYLGKVLVGVPFHRGTYSLFEIVDGLDKTNARVLYMIGLSYQKKGDKQKGMQLCDKAIEMDPSLNSLRQKQDLGMGL